MEGSTGQNIGLKIAAIRRTLHYLVRLGAAHYTTEERR
jgi:hypothetical protein